MSDQVPPPIAEDSESEFKQALIEDNKLAKQIAAFSNSHGGAICFGIDDAGKATVDRSIYAAHFVPDGCFIRLGSSTRRATPDELLRLAQTASRFHFETQTNHFAISEINKNLFNRFLRRKNLIFPESTLEDKDIPQLLRNS